MKKKNALIVDDDPSSALLFKHLLKDYNCIIATSGEEAVEKVRNNPFHIIMMDLKMPGIGGFQAIQMIREFNKEVFIIAQSAYCGKTYEIKAKESGCNEYISKPIDRQILMKYLEK